MINKVRTVEKSECNFQADVTLKNGTSAVVSLILPGRYGRIEHSARFNVKMPDGEKPEDSEMEELFSSILFLWNRNPSWEENGEWKTPDEWMKSVMNDFYYADCEKEGKIFNLAAEGNSTEEQLKIILEKQGYKVLRIVRKEGHHLCPECGMITDGEDENGLCENCRRKEKQ